MIDQLQQEYSQRFEKISAYRVKVWKVLVDCFFSRWTSSANAVLDLGCGWGEFINQVPCSTRYGIDLNPDSPSKLDKSVTFFFQDCSARWPLEENQLDLVFTSNFFEHLPDKASLARTLGEAFRCLKPGGKLICLGPNIKYLPGQYWDFWDHYLPLTELSLQEGCHLAGFETELVEARFLPYSMSQGFTPPLIFLKLFLKLPLLWKFVGKQFLVVMKKPR